ncbi:sulfatase [Mangrovibacterium sp.]|uniref:sulfatase n=1 Tax=Mangrovibacterium sp. TaxID=1961364 RepID=UPI003565A049
MKKSIIGTSVLLVLGCSPTGAQQQKPNILFIGVDDLRTELGCYGSDIAVSPNLDKLASEGMLFRRAYCQQAICGPSRASLMTGIRPHSSGITHNYIPFRKNLPNMATIPQTFIANGYDAVSYGKIFHHGDEDEQSWNYPQLQEARKANQRSGFALQDNKDITLETKKAMFAKYGEVAKYGLASGPAYECADVPDNAYVDGYNTDLAITALKELAKGEKPFFLALGMHKPHLNWIAPKKYWDYYDRDQIPLSVQPEAPEEGAEMGIHPSFELRVRDGIPKQGDLDPELARTLKHAYLACVSYIDAQIGRMIEALDEAGVRDNTIIIVWSDHGFHLGDMGIWGKATNYEISTRVPFMIWTPDMPKGSRGKGSDALVELVDMYPTLCDLAGIEEPGELEGCSFKLLLSEPDRPWKSAAFSQFPTPALREWGAFPLRPAMRETYFGPLLEEVEERIQLQQKGKWDRELFENYLMGYAMRTERYRLIAWKDDRKPGENPLFIELYDHLNDPLETKNIAAENPELVARLMAQLEAGWKGNLPKENSNN